MNRWMRRLALAVVVFALGVAAVTRYGGLLLRNADGRALGYSSATQEWLALDRPSHAASLDGPYVFERDGKREVLRLERDGEGQVVARVVPLEGTEISVDVDGAPARRFTVPLRESHPRRAVDVAMPARLLVASDFEGELDAFVALLQAHGAIGADLRWTFGRDHVVLVGDMVDRGANVVPLLWLVYRLEAEAEKAGGALHYVLGNHEQKLLAGRTDDVHPKYIGTIRLAARTHAALWGADTELGRWLRSKPVVLKVGEYLFMHGGVSPDVLALAPTLEEIDRHAAAYFATPPAEVADARARTVLWDRNGVLWYRGLAMALDGMPRADEAHVDAVLGHFGVRHVAIGHTLARHVGHDYGGKVLRIDVHHASGTTEGVLVEGGKVHRIDAAGGRHALDAAVNLD